MTILASISLTGPAFSFLLYENSKCQLQQEGFLLGEILHKEVKIITDNDQHQINISKTIRISAVLPCPQQYFFYNGTGKLDKQKLKDFLGDHFYKVVAWYRFRKTSNFKFSLRDKIIHRQLSELFGIPSDLFTYCFMIQEVSNNGSTYLLSQVFMRYHHNKYDHLPINIPNLSEPNNTYKAFEPASITFKKILDQLKIEKKSTQGLVIINKIQNAVQKHIDTIIKDLSNSEQFMNKLEEEVKVLEAIKHCKKFDKKNIEIDASFNSSIPQDILLKSHFPNEINPGRTALKMGNYKVKGKGRQVKGGKDGKTGKA